MLDLLKDIIENSDIKSPKISKFIMDIMSDILLKSFQSSRRMYSWMRYYWIAFGIMGLGLWYVFSMPWYYLMFVIVLTVAQIYSCIQSIKSYDSLIAEKKAFMKEMEIDREKWRKERLTMEHETIL